MASPMGGARCRVVGCGLAILLAVAEAAPAQTSPAVGKWKLDLANSTFEPGPPPRSQTTTIFTAGRYVRVTSKTVNAAGELSTIEYRISPNGEEVPTSAAGRSATWPYTAASRSDP